MQFDGLLEYLDTLSVFYRITVYNSYTYSNQSEYINLKLNQNTSVYIIIIPGIFPKYLISFSE